MMQPGFKKFVLRSLLALLPVFAMVVLYVVMDPYRVVRPYNGVAIPEGDTLETISNKRFIAVEGLKHYNPSQHYDSFIFGSSISSNFTAAAWKKHLPDTARVYHMSAGSETLTGIRDELRYLIEHNINIRHALFIMEEEMFRRSTRYDEMPYVAHPDVSSDVTWLQFHRLHFNAFRDPYVFLFKLFPSRMVGKVLAEGKVSHAPSGRNEVINEDYSTELDSMVMNHPDEYFASMQWLVDMVPRPEPMTLSIDDEDADLLREIAALLHDNGIDYKVIVPPRFRAPALSDIDHALLCEIMGEEHVADFSGNPVLVDDVQVYYDGAHILTPRCTELIDRCYEQQGDRYSLTNP